MVYAGDTSRLSSAAFITGMIDKLTGSLL